MQIAKPLAYKDNLNRKPTWGWIHSFVFIQFILQILLLFPEIGALRVVMRSASFLLSLFLFIWLPVNGRRHPCVSWAIAILGIMALEFFFHDDRNSVNAALAQCGIYAAIIAPVFWVTRLKVTFKDFYWLILMIWGFHTLSSAVGVLQVFNPGQYQGALSSAIRDSQWEGANLKIILASGDEIYRPQGLTDVPGGAAGAGFYAVLFSAGIALYESKWFMRVACLFSAGIGVFCIYLSQIRSTLIILGICLICFGIILYKQGKQGQASWLMGIATTIAVAVFGWASRVGGDSTVSRLSTLVEKDSGQVYYENRGFFLEGTIKLLFEKPLGVGLGRWGPISGYFGSFNPLSSPVWVEIQWTGWLVDGGIPMIIAYTGAIFVATLNTWKIATNRRFGDFAILGSLILGYDVGAFATTFNYPLFIGQGGLEFWLLNTALFVAASNYQLSKPTKTIP